jgi:hypothetical protein
MLQSQNEIENGTKSVSRSPNPLRIGFGALLFAFLA